MWCWCKHLCHQITKIFHVAPHIHHLQLMNEMVPFTMPLESHDADVCSSDIKQPKHLVAFYFDHLCLKMVWLKMILASCDNDTSSKDVTWQESHIAPGFNHFDLMNTMVLLAMPLASHDADASSNSVKWLKKIILDLILIILTYQMQWYHWWCHQCNVMPTLVSHNQKSYVVPHFKHLNLKEW